MIRELTVDDLPQLTEMAQAFFVEGKLCGRFNPDSFVKGWSGLLGSRQGLLLGAEEQGLIVATIGGILFPNLANGDLEATELHWYARPEHRGTGVGLRLLDEFEATARSRGSARVWMLHLTELNDAPMDQLYEWRGYRLKEKLFVKEL